MHTAGEPSITEALAPWLAIQNDETKAMVAGLLAKAKVKLRGPDLNTEHDIAINADGTFTTGAALMAGSYQVELPVNDPEVTAALDAVGVKFVGESMVRTIASWRNRHGQLYGQLPVRDHDADGGHRRAHGRRRTLRRSG